MPKHFSHAAKGSHFFDYLRRYSQRLFWVAVLSRGIGQIRATTVTINGQDSNDDFRFSFYGSDIVDIAIDNVGKLQSTSVHTPIEDSLFISVATTTNTSGCVQWNWLCP